MIIDMRIIGVVSVYNPRKEEIRRITAFSKSLELLIIRDDSENCELYNYDFGESIVFRANGENIGLSKSINLGIGEAVSLSADWIFLMDQDSDFEPEIIDIYRDFIEKNDTKKIALIAPQYDYDRHKRDKSQGVRRIRFSNMSGSLINVHVLKEVGAFDVRFFIDGLDIEWCLRAMSKKYILIECSEAVLKHSPANTGEIKLFGRTVWKYGYDSPERYYYQFKAFMLLHEMYHDIRTDLFGLYKIIKALFIFENKKSYRNAYRNAKRDFRRRYFGKYPDNGF